MARRQEWPLKGLRMDLKDGWYWLSRKQSWGKPFPAKFKTDSHLAGGGSWRIDVGNEDLYASYIFEEFDFLGPVEMITYEKD